MIGEQMNFANYVELIILAVYIISVVLILTGSLDKLILRRIKQQNKEGK